MAVGIVFQMSCTPEGTCATSPDSLDTPQLIAELETLQARYDGHAQRFTSELLTQDEETATVRVTVEDGGTTRSFRVQLQDVGLGDGFGGCSWVATDIEEVP